MVSSSRRAVNHDNNLAVSLAIILALTLVLIVGFRVIAPMGFFKGGGTQVEVSSNPTDAWIFVDSMGDQRGRTPQTIKVSAGTHKLILMRDGYEKWTSEFTVAAGETLKVQGDLTPLEGVTTTTMLETATTTLAEVEATTQPSSATTTISMLTTTTTVTTFSEYEGIVESREYYPRDRSMRESRKYYPRELEGGVSELEFSGYLVEFREEPPLVLRARVLEEIKAKEAELEKLGPKSSRVASLSSEVSSLKNELPRRITSQRFTVSREQDAALAAIERKLPSLGVSSKIRGQFTGVFNGVLLDVSEEEAEKLRKLPGVKGVYPNLRVHATLMDSVPLINADDVWRLDASGNDCNLSGEECLTGKNTSIAIIDTGIEYRHPDFGGCVGKKPTGSIVPLIVESAHPYGTDLGRTWVIRQEGFNSISVHFEQINVTENHDYLYVTRPDGTVVQSFTGVYEDFWSASVPGDSVYITLQGALGLNWGFRIDAVYDSSGGFAWNCSKFAGGYDFVNNDDDPLDDHGHGTHAAGIAAGNGTLRGVAPDARLYAFKVLNHWGCGTEGGVIAGIERSLDLDGDGYVYGVDPEEENPKDVVNVISLSLGAFCGGSYDEYCGPDDVLSRAVDAAVGNGVVAVVAAGNAGWYGRKTIGTPGTARKAITVGAVNKSDVIADFSSMGFVETKYETVVKPDVVAPGVEICAAQWDAWKNHSLCFDNQHIAISGTSMATPHVAGAAALLKQAHPLWTPDDVKNALMKTAVDVNAPLYQQGYGRVDVLKAVNQTTVPALEDCERAGDEDGNGLADCRDLKCPQGVPCDISHTRRCDTQGNCSLYERCDVAGDEDEDGLADCADASDCPDGTFCNPSRTHLCNGAGACVPPEDCQSRGDEDGDSLADCADVASCPQNTVCDFEHSKSCINASCSRGGGVPLDPAANQLYLAVYGDRVVWTDERNCNRNIHLFNLSSGTGRPITTDKHDQFDADISGDRIVWWDTRTGLGSSIYFYDLSEGMEHGILNVSGAFPKISGDKIVWDSFYHYNVSSGRGRYLPNTGFEPISSYDIYKNKVVYVSFNDINRVDEINWYDLDTGYEQFDQLSVGSNDGLTRPIRVYEDKVVFVSNDYNIYVYYLSNRTLRQITNSSDGPFKLNPDIYGNRIVWEGTAGRNQHADIYLFDLSTGVKTRITFDPLTPHFNPRIWGSNIFWSQGHGTAYAYFHQLPVEFCELPVDEDEDGLVDCADVSDCPSGTFCNTLHTSKCDSNGLCAPSELCDIPGDEDGDGFADCADITDCPVDAFCNTGHTMKCYPNRLCLPSEDCRSLDDEDGDGFSDCADVGDCDTRYCNLENTKRCLNATCGPVPTAVTSDEPTQRYPDASGNLVVWEDYRDYRNSGTDIYLYNISSGLEVRITNNSKNQRNPLISGDTILWRDDRNGYDDLYAYRLSTGSEQRITSPTLGASKYAISEDNIVWNYGNKVYLYNSSSGVILLSSSAQYTIGFLDVSGDEVVWSVGKDIYLFNLSSGVERKLTTSLGYLDGISVYGRYVVWPTYITNYDIFLFDISSGTQQRITNDSSYQEKPTVSADKIVWKNNDWSNRSNSGIYIYDIPSGVKQKISPRVESFEDYPRISDRYVVWERKSDVYVYDLSPPPNVSTTSTSTTSTSSTTTSTSTSTSSTTTVSCVDFDGGLNYSVASYAEKGNQRQYDVCQNAPTYNLIEGACSPSNQLGGYPYLCPWGCLGGLCMTSTTSSTTTSTTTSSSSTTTVPCVDTDGGYNSINLTVYGVCTGKGSTGQFFTVSDFCSNSTRLYECWCNVNNFVNGDYYNCPEVCSGGACVTTTSTSSTTTTTSTSSTTTILGGVVNVSLVRAGSNYYEYSTGYSCNPNNWCAIVDYSASNSDYEGELSFNLSSLAGASVSSASVCAYRYYLGSAVTNYIEKVNSSVCSKAPSVTSPPADIGSASIPNTKGWHCIPVNASQIPAGNMLYVRWWGNDLNGASTPYACYRGIGASRSNCGNSNPSGANDCRPYINITYSS